MVIAKKPGSGCIGRIVEIVGCTVVCDVPGTNVVGFCNTNYALGVRSGAARVFGCGKPTLFDRIDNGLSKLVGLGCCCSACLAGAPDSNRSSQSLGRHTQRLRLHGSSRDCNGYHRSVVMGCRGPPAHWRIFGSECRLGNALRRAAESNPVVSALIWCSFADRDSARAVANELLDRKLIACANILSGMESIFEWNGERGEDKEIGVLFKTNSSLLEEAIECLDEIHPYDTPAILGWHCNVAGRATEDWLNKIR